MLQKAIKHKDDFALIAFFSVLVRIVAFFVLMSLPLHDHKGNVVSPLVEQKGIDTPFYQKAAQQYREFGFSILYTKTENFYKNPSTEYDGMSPLPIFPLLLILFDYQAGNTLPLATLYLVISCLLCIVWLSWLKNNGCPKIGLWLFTIIPNPIYFMLAVGTDLPFALLFSLFFVTYFSKEPKNKIWIISLLLLCFLRPNALSVAAFVVFDQVQKGINTQAKFKFFMFSLFVLGITVIGIFVLPYFLVYLDLSRDFTYFGISNAEYLTGIYSQLPKLLDIGFSFITFIFAKLLYFCGLRPSYSDISLPIVFLRSFVGIFLLPGIINIMFLKEKKLALLIILFMLPIFLGATQDRYHLAIFPILYFYGIQFYQLIWRRIIYRYHDQ